MKPTIGRIVWFRTDGRNGLTYDLPAIITCTKDTHPGDYVRHKPTCNLLTDESEEPWPEAECSCTPTVERNPLPVPEDDVHVHLTVFTPGGYGSFIPKKANKQIRKHDSSEFVGAQEFIPGSGSYVEWNVPMFDANVGGSMKRTWRWPERS
jgi:hypothetical protein